MRLRQCEHNRDRERVWMNDRLLVNVIHLKRMSGGAVEQDCVRQRGSGAGSPERSNSVAALFLHDVAHHPGPRKSRAAKTYAKPIEKAELDAFDHVRRDVAMLRFGCE